jgi:DNA-binding CsgD family transcriptional regulator
MPVATRWPLVGRRDELDSFGRALADPGCEALCIYGPSGVGKTRLGDEFLDQASVAGRRVLRAAADDSTGEMPFGPVAHLMPADALAGFGNDDVVNPLMFARLFDAARQALEPAPGESGPPVLLLDDAHRVDSLSLTMIDRLMADRVLFCVATVVQGEPTPATVVRWWREERAMRIDLRELDQIGVDTLLHIALEGPLDAAASAELWRSSRGNVLALRELVLGAQARQVLVRRDRTWYLEGPLSAPTRLHELVELRVGTLDSDARGVLDLLALCQPIGLAQLDATVGLQLLDDLEQQGLIAIRRDQRREAVRLAHPLHGEVLRAALPVLRRRSILLAQADRVEAWGARRREDALRVATWRLDATGRADPDLLLRAARLARYDHAFGRAAKLAGAALAAEPSAAAGLILGEALYNLGSFDDAEAALAAATRLAAGDTEVVRVATVRRRNLFRGCRLEGEAVAVGQAAAARVRSTEAREELLAGEAEVLATSGRPREALALLDGLATATPRLQVLAGIPRASALAMTGRTTEAIAVARQAARDHAALGDELAISSPGTHRVNLLFAMTQAGRLDEADAQGTAWFDVAARARAPLGVNWVCAHLARGALAQGRPATALRWSARIVAAADSSRLEGLRPTAHAIAAAAHGLLGDAAAAAEHADEVDALPPGFGFLAPELPLGRAWALVAAGDIPSARALLLAAAVEAEAAGHLPAAAWLLHDAARLGAATTAAPQPTTTGTAPATTPADDTDRPAITASTPATTPTDNADRPTTQPTTTASTPAITPTDIAGRLAVLAAATDSELVAAWAEHVAALVAGEAAPAAERLADCAERFASMGALLPAAEAAAAAADAWRSRGEARRATTCDARAAELAERCEGARTPALARGRGVVPLTPREREIALLAAGGQSSRAIAERLYLSVRTVDNHLGRIYDKLGVRSRAELAPALGGDGTGDGTGAGHDA